MNYSIIIPHYNSWEKLERLLESIPKRGDIQTIVIDDNSENDRVQLLKEKYKHVEFYNNQTSIKGAGKARNIGLDKSKGKWLIFADADDYFVEGAFNYVDEYLNSGVEIVYFSPISKCEEKQSLGKRHQKYSEFVTRAADKKKEIEEKRLRYQFVVPWSKLILREMVLVNGIKFDEVLFSNDVMFSTKVGHFAKKIFYDKRSIYCVTESENSLTKNQSEKSFDIRFNVYLNYCKFLKDRNQKKYGTCGISYFFRAKQYGWMKALKVLKTLLKNRYKILPEGYRMFRFMKGIN